MWIRGEPYSLVADTPDLQARRLAGLPFTAARAQSATTAATLRAWRGSIYACISQTHIRGARSALCTMSFTLIVQTVRGRVYCRCWHQNAIYEPSCKLSLHDQPQTSLPGGWIAGVSSPLPSHSTRAADPRQIRGGHRMHTKQLIAQR